MGIRGGSFAAVPRGFKIFGFTGRQGPEGLRFGLKKSGFGFWFGLSDFLDSCFRDSEYEGLRVWARQEEVCDTVLPAPDVHTKLRLKYENPANAASPLLRHPS